MGGDIGAKPCHSCILSIPTSEFATIGTAGTTRIDGGHHVNKKMSANVDLDFAPLGPLSKLVSHPTGEDLTA
jgi:hypothetical protein